MLEHFYESQDDKADWRALRSEGYLGDARIRHPDGTWLKLEELPPLLRTLLATDGTVTKVLEAYFWEPVEVNALHLNVAHVSRPVPWLSLVAGDEVLTRHVELCGKRTGTVYAEAFSVLTLTDFDPPLREALVHGSVGIGVLLRESGLETYREIVEVGTEGNAADDCDMRVYRTYRITRGSKPVILIRESFPYRLYQALSL